MPSIGDRASAVARPPVRQATSPARWSQPSVTMRTGIGARRNSRSASGVALATTAIRRAETSPAPAPTREKFITLRCPAARAGLEAGTSRPSDTFTSPASGRGRVFKADRVRATPHPNPLPQAGEGVLPDHVGQEPEEAGALDRLGELALLLCGHRRDPRGHDLAALRDVAREELRVLVVDLRRVCA